MYVCIYNIYLSSKRTMLHRDKGHINIYYSTFNIAYKKL